jgi:hypothetical protein
MLSHRKMAPVGRYIPVTSIAEFADEINRG